MQIGWSKLAVNQPHWNAGGSSPSPPTMENEDIIVRAMSIPNNWDDMTYEQKQQYVFDFCVKAREEEDN